MVVDYHSRVNAEKLEYIPPQFSRKSLIFCEKGCIMAKEEGWCRMDGVCLSVKGVSKSYRGKKAVDGLSFCLAPGEVLGLIGTIAADTLILSFSLPPRILPARPKNLRFSSPLTDS